MTEDFRYRWRRAILAEIAWGTPADHAVAWYCDHYFGALDRAWVLGGCRKAGPLKGTYEAEKIFRTIITTQERKANDHDATQRAPAGSAGGDQTGGGTADAAS